MTAAGRVGEPEKGYGDCDAGDGDAFAQNGVQEERDEGGGEEFGVGGALVGGEEHVGVHRVEDCREQSRGGWSEFACQKVKREAAGAEG